MSRTLSWTAALLLGAAAVFVFSLVPVVASPTVFEFVQWTDWANNTHPMRDVEVQFWDEDVSFHDLMGTHQTNNLGEASQDEAGADPPLGRPDPFEIIGFINNRVFVSPNGTAANRHSFQTPTITDLNTDIQRIVTFDGTDDIGKSASVHQSVLFMHEYAANTLGAAAPQAPVRVPSNPVGTSASGQRINIERNVWSSWDVIHHEFGHFLADHNNLDGPNLGLGHGFGQDLIGRYDADRGTRLAWQEGLATYLGISAQEAGMVRTVVPDLPADVGNRLYQDFDLGITQPLETGNGRGEGNEAAVMRILWDLYDPNNPAEAYPEDDEYSDKWALGDRAVFDLMRGNTTLKDMWNDVPKPNPRRMAELGEVFERYGVSSVLQAPMDDVTFNAGQVTFEWGEQNSSHSTMFQVQVYDQTFANLLLASPILNGTNWTTPLPMLPGSYNWVTLNNSVADNNTMYSSGAYQFTLVAIPEPITMWLVAIGLVGGALGRRRSPSLGTSRA